MARIGLEEKMLPAQKGENDTNKHHDQEVQEHIK